MPNEDLDCSVHARRRSYITLVRSHSWSDQTRGTQQQDKDNYCECERVSEPP
jgi:hypothetical protein